VAPAKAFELSRGVPRLSSARAPAPVRRYLDKGRRYSGDERCKWEPSSADELTWFILSKYSGEEQAQLRRCIRYLKRWRDENFTSGAPVSIALTVAAARWFKPMVAEDGSSCDLAALHALVQKMRENFGNNWKLDRLAIMLPGTRIDLMSKPTPVQTNVFRQRLSRLQHTLSQCFSDVPLTTAVEVLSSQFGPDFPAA
jgi:hypothetical protein